VFFAGCFCVGAYFIFAAVQGDYGVFRRAEIVVETRTLEAELRDLQTEVARMENLTRRLSDTYLDLDLLDERARDILGMIRSDEIVVR
jgi:cell division protein FtsB